MEFSEEQEVALSKILDLAIFLLGIIVSVLFYGIFIIPYVYRVN